MYYGGYRGDRGRCGAPTVTGGTCMNSPSCYTHMAWRRRNRAMFEATGIDFVEEVNSMTYKTTVHGITNTDEEIYNMRRIDQARLALQAAQEQFAKVQARPTEPIREDTTIITFTKTFGKVDGTEYTYGAIRIEANGRWYTTIKSARTQYGAALNLSWDQLLDFIELHEDEDNLPQIWVATAFEAVN